jgi:predicted ABC-type ATPase
LSRPALTFVGGANGSGKTTLTRWNSELFREIPVLDPDTIGQTLQSTASAIFSIAGARQVLRSAKEHLRKSESFAVETTLAGKNYLRMMLEARREGFEIVLVYIGTELRRDQSGANQKSGPRRQSRCAGSGREAALQTQL